MSPVQRGTLVKPRLNPWEFARLAAGSRPGIVDVSFRSRDRLMRAFVPSTELWVAVKDVLVLEDYEREPLCRLSSLPADSTVVDAGAFVGLFSLKASPFARRVIALEPSRRNFPLLSQNVARNNASNVETRKVALSSARGTVEFQDRGTSSAVVSDGSGAYAVESQPFQDLVEELGGIDLLKMDIEGAEYGVILETPPSALRRVDRLVAEIHFLSPLDYERFPRLVKALQSSGMNVKTVPMSERNSMYGLTKPWRCSLREFNGHSSFPYRMLISVAYGLGPLGARLKSRFDSGGTMMLFARR